MSVDTLNVNKAAALLGWDENFIRATPGLLKLVRKAIKQDWLSSAQGKANFQREFKATNWYRSNASWARGYLIAAANGGADFEAKRETAREVIRARAQQLGATLTDEAVETFTTAYFMNGWGEEGRSVFLDRALAGELEDFDTSFIDFSKGGPQSIIAALRKTARDNGIRMSDEFYESAARSVISGLSTIGDHDSELRRQAATWQPQYADRVLAGENLRDIMSSHINVYARMFDKDPNAVELDDPNLRIAFNTVDDRGNPTTMGLWDYEKSLRRTDGWQYTREAHDKVSQLTGDIVRMFGYGG